MRAACILSTYLEHIIDLSQTEDSQLTETSAIVISGTNEALPTITLLMFSDVGWIQSQESLEYFQETQSPMMESVSKKCLHKLACLGGTAEKEKYHNNELNVFLKKIEVFFFNV